MGSSAILDYQRMEAELQALLGRQAVAVCRSTNGDVNTLAPSERPAVSRAVEHRRREFAAGRSAAREGMQRLGRSAASIPMLDDRSPDWPAGLTGSISHSRGVCISVVALKSHWKAVGVDVEQDHDLPRELWDSICLSSELERGSVLPETVQARWMMRIFSAKEAYYKWVYPQTRRMLEFHDVEIVMKPKLDSTDFLAYPLHNKDDTTLPDVVAGRLILEQEMIISILIQ